MFSPSNRLASPQTPRINSPRYSPSLKPIDRKKEVWNLLASRRKVPLRGSHCVDDSLIANTSLNSPGPATPRRPFTAPSPPNSCRTPPQSSILSPNRFRSIKASPKGVSPVVQSTTPTTILGILNNPHLSHDGKHSSRNLPDDLFGMDGLIGDPKKDAATSWFESKSCQPSCLTQLKKENRLHSSKTRTTANQSLKLEPHELPAVMARILKAGEDVPPEAPKPLPTRKKSKGSALYRDSEFLQKWISSRQVKKPDIWSSVADVKADLHKVWESLEVENDTVDIVGLEAGIRMLQLKISRTELFDTLKQIGINVQRGDKISELQFMKLLTHPNLAKAGITKEHLRCLPLLSKAFFSRRIMASQVFQLLDADGGGSLDNDEVRDGFTRMGFFYSPDALRELVNLADVSGNSDGLLDMQEFLLLLVLIDDMERQRKAVEEDLPDWEVNKKVSRAIANKTIS